MEVPARVDDALLLEPEETALAERAGDLAVQVHAMREAGEYEDALRAIAGLRPQVRITAMLIGPMSSIVVTLSRNALTKAVPGRGEGGRARERVGG